MHPFSIPPENIRKPSNVFRGERKGALWTNGLKNPDFVGFTRRCINSIHQKSLLFGTVFEMEQVSKYMYLLERQGI